jgi:hypothetical protein
MKEKQVETSEKEDLLSSIKEQINSFDNKAEILLAVIGVLFGLSITAITSLDQVSDAAKGSGYFIWFLVFASLFAASSIFSVTLTLLVIYPRKKKKPTEFDSCYYMDIAMNHERFSQAIKDPIDNDSSVERQIIANADVCAKKHKFFAASVWSLVPFAVFLLLELSFFVFLVIF